MKKFPHNDFSIGIPEGWLDATVVVIAGPPERGYSPSITVTRDRLEFESSAAQFASNQLASLQRELAQAGYRVIEEGNISVSDRPAYRRMHAFKVPESNVEVKQIQVYLIKGDQAITITFTDAAQSFERSRQSFSAALSQFQWLNLEF